jgi:hypothetical protein
MQISPEKPDTVIYFVVQVPVRYKMFVDKKCLHQVNNLTISVVKFDTKKKQLFNKNQQNFLKYWKFLSYF